MARRTPDQIRADDTAEQAETIAYRGVMEARDNYVKNPNQSTWAILVGAIVVATVLGVRIV